MTPTPTRPWLVIGAALLVVAVAAFALGRSPGVEVPRGSADDPAAADAVSARDRIGSTNGLDADADGSGGGPSTSAPLVVRALDHGTRPRHRITLFARCVDETDAPLPGVGLRAHASHAASQSLSALDIVSDPATSGPDGEARLELSWPAGNRFGAHVALRVGAEQHGRCTIEWTAEGVDDRFVDLGVLRLERAVTVAGRCVDETGSGLANVDVWIGSQPDWVIDDKYSLDGWSHGAGWPLEVGLRKLATQTADDGSFSLDEVPVTVFADPLAFVYATAGRIERGRWPLEDREPDGPVLDLGSVAVTRIDSGESAPASVQGLVLDDGGEPVAKAEVGVLRFPDELQQIVTTDDQGRFEIENVSGDQVTVVARAPRGWTASGKATPGGELSVLRYETKPFTLHFVDAATSEPVRPPEDTEFRVGSDFPPRSASAFQLTPDDVHWDESGTVTLTVPGATRWIRTDFAAFETTSETLGAEATLTIPPRVLPREVHGRVLDARDLPVADALVRTHYDAEWRQQTGPIDVREHLNDGTLQPHESGVTSWAVRRRSESTRTDAHGRFTVRANGFAAVSASHPEIGHARSFVGLAAPSEAIELVLEPFAVARGRVVVLGDDESGWSGTVFAFEKKALAPGRPAADVSADHPEFELNTHAGENLSFEFAPAGQSLFGLERDPEAPVSLERGEPIDGLEIFCARVAGVVALQSSWADAPHALLIGYSGAEFDVEVDHGRFRSAPFPIRQPPLVQLILFEPSTRLQFSAVTKPKFDGDVLRADFRPRMTTVVVPDRPVDIEWTLIGFSEDGWSWIAGTLRPGMHTALPVGIAHVTARGGGHSVRHRRTEIQPGQTCYLVP